MDSYPGDSFTFNDVLQLALNKDDIVNDRSMAGNPRRVKLEVIRALEGLTDIGMITNLDSDPET